MKSFIQPGDALELTAPAGGVVSGGVYQFGPAGAKLIAIADHDADAAAKATFNTEGVFEVTKQNSDDFVEGEEVYWDESNDRVEKKATGFFKMGTSTETTASGVTVMKVKLSGQTETVVA